jgi:hypothetical protein
MPSEDFLGIKGFTRRDGIAFGAMAAIGLLAFVIWAVQTDTKIVTYRGGDTSVVDLSVNAGWEIIDTDVERRDGDVIGRIHFEDELTTTVTMKRSNWAKLWKG